MKRSKNRIQDPYTLVDFYDSYLDWVEDRENYTLSRKDFIRIVTEFNKEVVKAVLEGKEFWMPAGLGRIRIIKRKPSHIIRKFVNVDWPASREHGKLIFHVNEHSDGYIYRIRWDETGKIVKNGFHYYFLPCRAFKRTLAKVIKNRDTDYYQLD